MDYTENLKLPLLIPNQAGKEIMHNEALVIIDNILHNGIISMDLFIPPENPNTNDIYIVGKNANGSWENKDGQLAFYDNGWRFIVPREGFVFWINDIDKLYCYNGTKWQEVINSNESMNNITTLQNLSLCGINTTADNENKLSVKSDYVLFDNETSNSKIKVNKAADVDTASHLFQNNYVGKAEFGLIGDDNFTLKVSDNGQVWNDVFVVDKETGNIDFKGEITKNGNNFAAGMPIPQTSDSSKIGYYTAWWNGNNYKLPDGGTWLVWSTHQQTYNSFTGIGSVNSKGCGLFAGGSTITYGSLYTIGWAIRIQ